MNKKIVVSAALLFALTATAMTTTTAAYAQLQRSMITGTVSPTAAQIIDSVKAECAKTIQWEPELEPLVVEECLFLLYESATTVVLKGDLLISETPGGFIDNPFIWQAVDEFKVQGYVIESVSLAGQGSQGNPHKLYVVMSK